MVLDGRVYDDGCDEFEEFSIDSRTRLCLLVYFEDKRVGTR